MKEEPEDTPPWKRKRDDGGDVGGIGDTEVGKVERGDWVWVSMDSGRDEHCCPAVGLELGEKVSAETPPMPLWNVEGEPMKTNGIVSIRYDTINVDDERMRFRTDFVVTNATKFVHGTVGGGAHRASRRFHL